MNRNFQGAPDREDLQILDQMRRQLLPMIAVMNKLQHEMQYKMERGIAVDWYVYTHLRQLLKTPTHWLN